MLGAAPSCLQELSDFVGRVRWLSTVQHRMAIRAYRPEISNRINLVVGPKARQGVEVMDMNEASHQLPIDGDEIEAAEEASCTIIPDAFLPGVGITLVTID